MIGRIWSVGVGGIGSAMAARLVKAGHDIILVDDWKEAVDTINRDGLIVDYVDETVRVEARAIRIDDLAAEQTPPDLVLLAVKSYETEDIVNRIAPYLPNTSAIVSLQNCLNEEVIAAIVGADRVIGAICLYDGGLSGPGHAFRRRPGGKVIVGELSGERTDRIAEVAALLADSIATEVSDNIVNDLWSKLVRNVMFNAPSAITQLGAGPMVRDEVILATSLELGREGVQVASALGIDLVPADLFWGSVEDYLGPRTSSGFQAIRADYINTYQDHPDMLSSMAHDVARGRPTEINFLNGYISRRGAELGIATPANNIVARLVEEIDQGLAQPSVELFHSAFDAMAWE